MRYGYITYDMTVKTLSISSKTVLKMMEENLDLYHNQDGIFIGCLSEDGEDGEEHWHYLGSAYDLQCAAAAVPFKRWVEGSLPYMAAPSVGGYYHVDMFLLSEYRGWMRIRSDMKEMRKHAGRAGINAYRDTLKKNGFKGDAAAQLELEWQRQTNILFAEEDFAAAVKKIMSSDLPTMDVKNILINQEKKKLSSVYQRYGESRLLEEIYGE